MSSGLRLDRLVRRPPVATLLDLLDPAVATTIVTADERVLRGDRPAGPSQPLVVDGDVVGRVVGDEPATVAAVLHRLCATESERRAMADELLAMYREVNLLYALVERFAGLDDRSALAERALAEVTRLVPADRGAVVVIDGDGVADVAAAVGPRRDRVPSDLGRARTERQDDGALLVAPLALNELHRGAVVLTRDDHPFTAAELKLGCAVASQAAAFVERVLESERRRAESEAREARLRQQIDELRIQLDDRRQEESVRTITDTDYFANLREQAEHLRSLVGGQDAQVDDSEAGAAIDTDG